MLMDASTVWQRRQGLAMCGILLLLGILTSGNELNYVLRGRTAKASIVQVTAAKQGSRQRNVEFEFRDVDGTLRHGCDAARTEGIRPGRTIDVCYIPGAASSARLARGGRSGLGLLVVALGMLGYFVFVFGRARRGSESGD
jgi:hypothetical protein